MTTPTLHRVDPAILGEYDVRGTVGRTLFPADVHALARALATQVRAGGGRRMAVGWDGRLSSPELGRAAVEGVRAAGVDVLELGTVPTPLLYFAVHELADGGIQVTGSHNPPDQNGLKFMRGTQTVYGEAIRELARLAESGSYAAGRGRVYPISVMDAYLDTALRDAPTGGLSVVWDPGNGAAGDVITELTRRLPGTHTLINAAIDGTFPAHHPDPTVPENLAQLQRAVIDGGHDLGVAFDGDGDRLGAVDRHGRPLAGDELLLMLAREVVAANPGAPVIADVKTSRVVFDALTEWGAEPVMWKTGHALIKAKMRELNAPLAGEMSAHIFFNDTWYGFDDAIYAAIRLVRCLDATDGDLAAMKDALPPTVATPERRIPVPGERKVEIIEQVRASLADSPHAVIAIDGVRATLPDGWWLIRASNTQDVLVARCEAGSEAALHRLAADLRQRLTHAGVPSENVQSL